MYKLHSNDANKVIYPELSYKITGLFYEVHNNLGRFCREKQYGDELNTLLLRSGINFKREASLVGFGKNVSGNIADFIVDDKIIVELKAKNFITKEDYYQMLRYLESSKMKLGLLVNFRNVHLKPKRIINLKNNL